MQHRRRSGEPTVAPSTQLPAPPTLYSPPAATLNARRKAESLVIHGKHGERPLDRDTAWRRFGDFCDLVGANRDTATALSSQHPIMFDFVVWLHDTAIANGRPLAPSTLRTYLSRVCSILAVRSHAPVYRDPAGTALLRRLEAQPHTRHHRVALPAAVLTDAFVGSDSAPGGDTALRTALAVAYSCLLRVSEYTTVAQSTYRPQTTLLRQHVSFDAAGRYARIHLVTSKTDRHFTGADVYLYNDTATNATSGYRALVEYFLATPHHRADQPLFTLANGKFVTRQLVNTRLKQLARRHGLDPSNVSSHSLRITGARHLADAGLPDHVIQLAGRWTSGCFAKYIRHGLPRAQAITPYNCVRHQLWIPLLSPLVTTAAPPGDSRPIQHRHSCPVPAPLPLRHRVS